MLQKKQENLVPFDEAVGALYELCSGRYTGLLCILTSERHGAAFALSEGKIIDIAYLKSRGTEALKMMQKVSRAKYLFKQDLSLSDKQPNHSNYLPAGNVILSKLGMNVTAAPSWMGKEIKKILLVDDSPLSRKVILNVFAGKSYDITEAEDGRDALDKLNDTVPDMVLLDLILPKIDGYQVLSTMKKNDAWKNIPVIILTSRDALMDKVKGKMLATDEYLTKPVNAEELMSKVQEYLG